MLMQRIQGAFMLNRQTFRDVENDPSFTSTAWMIVAVTAFLSQLGARAGAESFFGWLIGAIIGTVFVIIGFAVGAWLIAWVGSSFFNAEVTFDEMVRTLGLAYVWNIIGVIGILAFISPTLTCLLAPLTLLAALLGLVAWFIAANEALDLDWGRTILVVVIGWVVVFVASLLATAVLALLGITAGAIFG